MRSSDTLPCVVGLVDRLLRQLLGLFGAWLGVVSGVRTALAMTTVAGTRDRWKRIQVDARKL